MTHTVGSAWASPGARDAETLVLCSTSDDAFLVHRLTGIASAFIGGTVLPGIAKRTVGRHIVLAMRRGESGEAFAEALRGFCTESASVVRIPLSAPLNDIAVRSAFEIVDPVKPVLLDEVAPVERMVPVVPANPWHGIYGRFGEHCTRDMVERMRQVEIPYGLGYADEALMKRFESQPKTTEGEV